MLKPALEGKEMKIYFALTTWLSVIFMLGGCASTTYSQSTCSYSEEELTDIKRQTENGSADMQIKSAGIYIAGVCLNNDNRIARELTHKAAQQGNVTAQSQLAFGYTTGIYGFEKDPVQAIFWYKKSGTTRRQVCTAKTRAILQSRYRC
jgi:hypothetical protein